MQKTMKAAVVREFGKPLVIEEVAVPRPGPGDLLVMGGTCQTTWEHAVPKVRAAGPRISVQFRQAGVD